MAAEAISGAMCVCERRSKQTNHLKCGGHYDQLTAIAGDEPVSTRRVTRKNKVTTAALWAGC